MLPTAPPVAVDEAAAEDKDEGATRNSAAQPASGQPSEGTVVAAAAASPEQVKEEEDTAAAASPGELEEEDPARAVEPEYSPGEWQTISDFLAYVCASDEEAAPDANDSGEVAAEASAAGEAVAQTSVESPEPHEEWPDLTPEPTQATNISVEALADAPTQSNDNRFQDPPRTCLNPLRISLILIIFQYPPGCCYSH